MTPETIVLIQAATPGVIFALKAYLEQDGYRVLMAHYGEEISICPDLLIVDQEYLTSFGKEALVEDANYSGIPIFLLCDEADNPAEGAYFKPYRGDVICIHRPIRHREFSQLLRTTLQAAGKGAPKGKVLHGSGIILDRERHIVRIDNRIVDLTPIEFDLLSTMMNEPGVVFSRQTLRERVFGVGFAGSERTVDVHIKNLRFKLNGVSSIEVIKTVYRKGYQFSLGNTVSQEP